MADAPTELTESSDKLIPHFVIGIGAADGALQALEEFFADLSSDFSATYVVVQNQPLDEERVTVEVLAKLTSLSVVEATDGAKIAPGTVYVMPERVEMILSDGCLLLSEKDDQQKAVLPVDVFFKSLARDAAEHAIAVVLSGRGNDGCRGIREVNRRGGFVISQSTRSAIFDGMPKSAVETGVCEFELPANEIAQVLAQRFKAGAQTKKVAIPHGADGVAFETLLGLIKTSCGIDFSHYKPGTIDRRLERRLLLNKCESLPEYVKKIADDDNERDNLSRDLLIGVTQFLRDPAAWSILNEMVVAPLLKSVDSTEEIRMWVAGCSTGQEAYTLAALITEQQRKLGVRHDVKLFATDVDEAALATATRGHYSSGEVKGLDEHLLHTMFERHKDGFQVRADLRKMIVFAKHDLTTDPPFTRLHLVACRNVLIYLKLSSQQRILSLFHFGLRTDGVMFLGSSESTAALGSDMHVVSDSAKLFRKTKNLPLPNESRVPRRTEVAQTAGSGITSSSYAEASVQREILATYDCLLGQFMPCSVLVNERLELIQVFGNAARFFTLAEGRFSGHVSQLASPVFSRLLESLFKKASDSGQQIEIRNVEVKTKEGIERLRVAVQEVKSDRIRIHSWLFCFYPELPEPNPSVSKTPSIELDAAEFDRVKVLEKKLSETQQRLKTSVESLESANEELHLTNEEMVVSHEQLQSTNEELHSVNEELHTVNAEHQQKIDELVEVTNDLENLFRSSQVGTVFLDLDLAVRRFTPMAAKYCKFGSQDLGRAFESFAHQLSVASLMKDVQHVLQTGERIEIETDGQCGQFLMIQIFPYLVNEQIQGIILTMVDISTQQLALQKSERIASELDELYRTAPVGLAVMDKQLRYVRINDYLAEINGKPASEHIGQRLQDVVPQLVDVIEPLHRQVIETGQPTELIEVCGSTPSDPDRIHTWLVRYYPIRTNHEVVAVASIVTDVSALTESEQQLQRKQQELERSNRELEEFAYAASHDLQEPLRTISTYCEAINDDYRSLLDEDGLNYLNFVVDATRRMRAQIHGLLEYSRIGRASRKFRPVDLNAVLQNVREDLATSISEAEASFECGTLPTVTGDQRLLHALFLNLISNSLKFRSKSQKPTIQISSILTGTHWQLSIIDNGIGIDPSQSIRIFQVFQRLHSASDYPGTGIGLSLCKRIVELHGGTIKLEHQEAGGTCFHVLLAVDPQ